MWGNNPPRDLPPPPPPDSEPKRLRIGECVACGKRFTPDYERSLGMLICEDCARKATKTDSTTVSYEKRPDKPAPARLRPNDKLIRPILPDAADERLIITPPRVDIPKWLEYLGIILGGYMILRAVELFIAHW